MIFIILMIFIFNSNNDICKKFRFLLKYFGLYGDSHGKNVKKSSFWIKMRYDFYQNLKNKYRKIEKWK